MIRNTHTRFCLVLVIVFMMVSCTEAPKTQQDMKPGDFAHTVFFWLKNPDTPADRAAFEASLTKFIEQSVHIQTKHIGIPAATDRDVIDNSYTYSLLLTFEDKEAQDRYQDEPAHKLFISESSDLWKKVVVYDSENILE